MALLVSSSPRINISKQNSCPFSRRDSKLKTDGMKKLKFSGKTPNWRCPSGLFLMDGVRRTGGRVFCSASAAFTSQNLHWISAASSVILMITKGTGIRKSLLVPYLALQAPISAISWIKSEQGTWTIFLALIVRLFYFIPGELELPFQTMLFLTVAPYQLYNLRKTPASALVSLAIAGYLSYQHFKRLGSLRKAFDQGSIIATLAIICVVIVPCIFLY